MATLHWAGLWALGPNIICLLPVFMSHVSNSCPVSAVSEFLPTLWSSAVRDKTCRRLR